MLAPTLEGPAPTTTYFADALQLTSSAKATAFAQISPELPVALYGRGMKIAGAELCYKANATAELWVTELEMITESNGIGEALPLAQVAADLTSRTDNTCRTYRAASPVPIGPDDQVLLSVAVRFPTSSVSTFQIGRTSFFLQP